MGRIAKPHGLRGEVVVVLTTTEDQRVAPGAVLEADGRSLRVTAARPHQDRWIVAFEGLASREAADELRGAVLRAAPLVGPDDDTGDDLWVHQVIGARVVDQHGVDRGVVEAVQANPASDLLVLASGALVPMRFVVGWREPATVLEVDVPPGLFDE